MFIIHKEIYNTRGDMTDHENICLFGEWAAAQEYMEMQRSKYAVSDRDIDIENTGAGFIVSFKDGLQRQFHYKCERIMRVDKEEE